MRYFMRNQDIIMDATVWKKNRLLDKNLIIQKRFNMRDKDLDKNMIIGFHPMTSLGLGFLE